MLSSDSRTNVFAMNLENVSRVLMTTAQLHSEGADHTPRPAVSLVFNPFLVFRSDKVQ